MTAATPKAPATDAGEVEITARQRSPIVADYGENYLVARVSSDGKQVGIDHPCDAVWSDVMRAHVALRDYINERIARQDACPFKVKALATPPAPNDDLRAALEEAIDRMGWPEIHAFQDELRKGQDIREDAGGFMLRAIKALFGIKPTDPVTTYQQAARALVDAALKENRRG